MTEKIPRARIPLVRRSAARPIFLSLPALFVLLIVGTSSASAQSRGWGFDLKMGYSQLGGEWAEVMDDGVDAELNVFYGLEKLRLGGGINLVSYGLLDPTEDVESASQVGLHLAVGYPFPAWRRIQPYVEARLTWDRLRPEGHEEGFPPPEEEGENTGPQASGFGGTAVAGVFVGITERLFADFSGRFGGFKTSISQLDYLEAPDVASASRWGIRAGLVWYWQGGDR
jgi:hypothetical protein